MSKVVKPENMGDALSDILAELVDVSAPKIDRGVRAALDTIWGNIIKETPVDDGFARGGWVVTSGSPSRKKIKRKTVEDVSLKISTLSVFPRKKGILSGLSIGSPKKWFLTNNIPYIVKLEYGEYPNPVKRGTYVKGKGYEVRSVGGYSQIAPKGMVRKNMVKWPRALKAAFNL